MLECRPLSFWSSDFQITGSSTGPILTKFDRKTGNGTIDYSGQQYGITHPTSGYWVLKSATGTCADASTITGLIPAVEINSQVTKLMARTFSSGMVKYFASEIEVGIISHTDSWTRTSAIDFYDETTELTQAFCFWLVSTSWYFNSERFNFLFRG
jgi:hypothetical protein